MSLTGPCRRPRLPSHIPPLCARQDEAVEETKPQDDGKK